MTLVVVNRNPGVFDDHQLRVLVDDLPVTVADYLSCDDPGGKLTPQDIEVWVQDFGPFDVNTKDVEIIIWANLYPGREANLDDRRQCIIEDVVRALNAGRRIPTRSSPSGFVWILLQPSSFGEF